MTARSSMASGCGLPHGGCSGGESDAARDLAGLSHRARGVDGEEDLAWAEEPENVPVPVNVRMEFSYSWKVSVPDRVEVG